MKFFPPGCACLGGFFMNQLSIIAWSFRTSPCNSMQEVSGGFYLLSAGPDIKWKQTIVRHILPPPLVPVDVISARFHVTSRQHIPRDISAITTPGMNICNYPPGNSYIWLPDGFHLEYIHKYKMKANFFLYIPILEVSTPSASEAVCS